MSMCKQIHLSLKSTVTKSPSSLPLSIIDEACPSPWPVVSELSGLDSHYAEQILGNAPDISPRRYHQCLTNVCSFCPFQCVFIVDVLLYFTICNQTYCCFKLMRHCLDGKVYSIVINY